MNKRAILQNIRTDAFNDEFEKLSSPQGALIGGTIGSAAGALYGRQIGKLFGSITGVGAKKLKSKDLNKIRSLIQKSHPELKIVSSPKKVLGYFGMPNSKQNTRAALGSFRDSGSMYMKARHGSNPMVYFNKNDGKFGLGHEIGHHTSRSGRFGKIRRALRPGYLEERRAWKLSPFAGQPGESEIKRNALRSYEAPLVGGAAGGTAGGIIGSSVGALL